MALPPFITRDRYTTFKTTDGYKTSNSTLGRSSDSRQENRNNRVPPSLTFDDANIRSRDLTTRRKQIHPRVPPNMNNFTATRRDNPSKAEKNEVTKIKYKKQASNAKAPVPNGAPVPNLSPYFMW